MEVPFTSSGAMSRAQYAFVRKVESATSPSEADQHILSEIEVVRRQLADPGLSLNQCKECLVILLYCAMNVSILPPGGMEFALPHAVHLAESGMTTQDKRLGYQFCCEMMPESHELQLLLVNTLRKDIESSQVPRICLALEALIHSPFEDVIPAVQSRLYDLLSHNSPDVRRRAVAALSALSCQEPSLLANATDNLMKRLKDSQPVVISAALIAAVHLREVRHASTDRLTKTVNALLLPSWDPNLDKTEYWFLLRVLGALAMFRPTEGNLRLILRIIEWTVNVESVSHALLFQCFQLISTRRAEITAIVRTSSHPSPILHIRSLISSTDPNDQYLVLACMECLDAATWAGTTPEIPGVLDKWEVERIMGLLESTDAAIRRKTLKVLKSADANIVESYHTRILQNIPEASFVEELSEAALRALEIIDAMSGTDGAAYATRLQSTLAAFEDRNENVVLERVVEQVLTKFRTSEDECRLASLTVMLDQLSDMSTRIGATSMVILTALIVEYFTKVGIPARKLLQGLATRLSVYPSSVKDACLLAMVRLAAESDVPTDVLDAVRGVSETSGRYIRRRCEQFVTLSAQRETVRSAVAQAKSSSLPDFLLALEASIASPASMSSRLPSSAFRPCSPSASRNFSASKLRYDAYEAPRPHSRLLRPTSPRSTGSSEYARRSPSVLTSPGSEGLALHEDPLARTVTAGDLTLAAGDPDLIRAAERGSKNQGELSNSVPDLLVDDEVSSMQGSDLIALESPFVSEPADLGSSVSSPDFETIWSDMERTNLRGWCDFSIDAVVRRLQGLQLAMRVIAADQLPFEGDLKIIISAEAGTLDQFRGAVLRLRESDDESCLWRLRCDDVQLRMQLKRLLSE
ncbi:ARM repeat-containing protein [Heliocybe sulcata]|uniref:ARM repeat-containing protein n=1 Tax=Heliocybe sulcata TaxID=5364 RepID=A0A5C3MP99_9AGAM|nr:ARM repeat-containing protein [Heliocybe sulcata]